MEQIYSSVVAIFAILAIVAAHTAMRRGLTYSAMVATTWALTIIAAARIWHAIIDISKIIDLSEIGEKVEYTLYLIAYLVFIWLVFRAFKVKMPKK